MQFIYFSSPGCGACEAMRLLKVKMPLCTLANSPFDDSWVIAEKHGVEGIPCLLHVESGEKLMGVKTQAQVDAWVSQFN